MPSAQSEDKKVGEGAMTEHSALIRSVPRQNPIDHIGSGRDRLMKELIPKGMYV